MEQRSKVRALSVVKWHELSLTGANIPVEITVNGTSMQPLIRRNRDLVKIVPLQSKPMRGDIVMFVRNSEHPYVLHRVWKIKDNAIQTWGDNCVLPDGWFELKDIWGIAVGLKRGNKEYDLRSTIVRKIGILTAPIFHMRRRIIMRVLKIAKYIPAPIKSILKIILRSKQ